MTICPFCETKLNDTVDDCPSCGARHRRDKRGLVSGPAFLLVAVNVVQDSIFFGLLIALLGLYGLSTLRNFRWIGPKA